MTIPPDIETLAAIEAIKQLKARYFRCLDMRDWAGYAATFAADGTLTVDSLKRDELGNVMGSRTATGSGAIVDWVSGVLAGATTIHHGHMPEITIETPERASGIWAMVDRVIWPDRWLRGWGHYHETYRKSGGEWRISSSRLTRLHVEIGGASVADGTARMLDELSAGQAG